MRWRPEACGRAEYGKSCRFAENPLHLAAGFVDYRKAIMKAEFSAGRATGVVAGGGDSKVSLLRKSAALLRQVLELDQIAGHKAFGRKQLQILGERVLELWRSIS